ncbi:hypothetical protein A2cp1_3433 [Anaeromyxobacter dehalogenans 2CP-1]|uniref:Homeodomain phBC6A51-type domain-containing protein n=1 Tax=Anaeromyxobacter dehalogenans (strain ATCC BAA-258 / DSM 21875 / 2CP-1) TaxID=455488 RepID=B8J5A1_ANAD2|nr:hypothetical protein [Anaeromyxobacter dehalogenans]ACL66763.1 hypothetical protein A2cp1_3433 [Anaeromyxobacter dehalogenans 2CP-1]
MTASVTPMNGARRRSSYRKRVYHDRLLAAFVQHTRTEDVAKHVRLSVRTVQRWRAIPECWAEVEAARGEVIRDAVTRLRNGLPSAADRLVQLARGAKSDHVAARAAQAVIEAHATLTVRQDLDARLARVEELLAACAARWALCSAPPATGASRRFETILGGAR